MRFQFMGKLFAAAICSSLLVMAQPKPKSQKELEAIQAVFSAPDPDSRIKAASELITKFADTEFKTIALQVLAMSYQQKNDIENMIVYAERTLEADPQNYASMLMIGQGLASRTREFDLDKEEKLGRAEKIVTQAMEIIKTAPKPRPDLPDEQWEQAKKDTAADAMQTLGMVATVRKKYDDAIKFYTDSIAMGSQPDPATKVRLAVAQNLAGKYDEAIKTVDSLLALPDLHPAIKQFAMQEKQKAEQAKAAKK